MIAAHTALGPPRIGNILFLLLANRAPIKIPHPRPTERVKVN